MFPRNIISSRIREIRFPTSAARAVHSKCRALLALAAALCVLAASDVAFAKGSFEVKPVPPWVKPAAVVDSGAGVADDKKGGTLMLLDDHQTRVAGSMVERFYRHAKKIMTQGGLENSSELQLVFEPSYQRLVIHHIRIIRGGQTVNALEPREIKIIQQEDELNQRLYNGRLSAVVFLKDVRVGDVIDCAYSVNGDNPVLGGRFADTAPLADSLPIQILRNRLLWPSERKLSMRGMNTDMQPSINTSDGVTEYLWERAGVAALDYEGSTPAWFDPTPHVQLSEFADWGEVVRWAKPLYEVKNISPELARRIEEWRAASADPGERTRAALRFVQDEVRYLGIELGPYSHQPSQPATVFARRFGDCKDKSLLLSTILNALGIEARPALVNTEATHALDGWQPSPYAFDHVIVRAQIGGQTFWLDPTMSFQRGGLAQSAVPNYGRALVLGEGVGALEEISLSATGTVTTEVREIYTIADASSPVAFEVVTVYRESDADGTRASFSEHSISDLGKKYLNYYAERHPGISADGLPQISDDTEANTITVRERYRIPNFWEDEKHEFWADRIYSELSKPEVSQRTSPLYVPYPLHIAQSVEINFPGAPAFAPRSASVSNDAMTLDYKHTRTGNQLKLEYTLRTLRDHVPAGKTANYLRDLGRMQKSIGFELARGAWGRDAGAGSWVSGSQLTELVAVILLLMPCALVAYAIYRALKRRRPAFTDEILVDARGGGASAAAAVRVRSEDELIGQVRAWTSSCGRSFYREGTPLAHEGLTYNGERLILVRLKCEACGETREAYFTKPQTPGGSDVPSMGDAHRSVVENLP